MLNQALLKLKAKVQQVMGLTESMTFSPRVVANPPGSGPDTFPVSYSLTNVRRHPVTAEYLQGLGSGDSVGISSLTFTVWQSDLDQAGAPAPQLGDELTDGSGVVYTVDRAVGQLQRAKWTVTVHQAR